MNPYLFSIYFLFAAALCQAIAGIFSLQSWLDRTQPKPRRRVWLAFGASSSLLAVHHGYTLSLATQAGLYDFRQATLAVLAAALMAYAIVQLRRQV